MLQEEIWYFHRFPPPDDGQVTLGTFTAQCFFVCCGRARRQGCEARTTKRGIERLKDTILLTEKPDGGFHVSIPALPYCTFDANTQVAIVPGK
jgi:hypothetical protein